MREWSAAEDEWVKRAAFATGDDRDFVKKAVNWAMWNIGKRDLRLHAAAIATAEAILAEADERAALDRRDSAARSGHWIARDALRELRSDKAIERVRRRG